MKHNTPNLNTQSCRICRGAGKLYVEHADGSPRSEQVCPYCKGARNSTWVKERFDTRQSNTEWVKILIGLFWAFLWATSWTPMWHRAMPLLFALWVVGLAGGMWIYTHPKPKRKPRQTNPLTTDREKLLGAAVLGGALLKSQYDHRHTNPSGPSPNNWW